jgi:triacylglycerol lipase
MASSVGARANWGRCCPIGERHFRSSIRHSVDYGEEHSKDAGHARMSPTLNFAKGFVENWSAKNPVVLIGHSAGAHTCLQLQMLLAKDFWGIGSNADWVEAVVCVAGVLNGSTLTYKFGCDKDSGLLTGTPGRLIDGAVDIARQAQVLKGVAPVNVELWLDHWSGNTDAFVRGTDNLAYDLTLQGCRAANEKFHQPEHLLFVSRYGRGGAGSDHPLHQGQSAIRAAKLGRYGHSAARRRNLSGP